MTTHRSGRVPLLEALLQRRRRAPGRAVVMQPGYAGRTGGAAGRGDGDDGEDVYVSLLRKLEEAGPPEDVLKVAQR